MILSRRVLPFLLLHLVLEQISAAVISNGSKTRREVDWLDRELFSHLSDPSDTGDVSVGDAGDIRREGDKRPSQSETAAAPTANVPVQNQQQQQNRRANENRQKVARLDPIGRFQIPTFRKRKGKTNVYSED